MQRTDFNGATARTRWKADLRTRLSATLARLQRGHRANAVERSSRSRTTSKAPTDFNGATARTRWKGVRGRAARAQRIDFNGATARTRWKVLERDGLRVRLRPTSTGPPRERGGKKQPTSSAFVPPTYFNGATARTRWKGRSVRACAQASRHFNGATARTRWKAVVSRPRGLQLKN